MHTDNTFEDAYLKSLGYVDDEPAITVSNEIEPAEAITKKVCILTDNQDIIDLVSKDILTITIDVQGEDENDITTIEIPVETIKSISIEDADDNGEVDFETEVNEEDDDEESDAEEVEDAEKIEEVEETELIAEDEFDEIDTELEID